MKIVIFETEECERHACLRLAREHEITCVRTTLDDQTVTDHSTAEVVSTSVYSTLTADVLAQLPHLKLIATRSTGYDHIDLGYCARRGITVSNVPDYGDVTVAEHTFALLLAAVRHVVPASERTRRGDFSQSGLRGIELRGKTLSVIGTGRIGRRVIEIAKGFGMKVLAHDVSPDDTAARQLGFRYVNLPEAIASADVLTIHVPATSETSKLISDREFELMKQGSVLINTSRGSTVDVTALVRALTAGRLRAVGLDVLPQEKLIREEAEIFRAGIGEGIDLRELVAIHVLLQFDNVLVTPHTAYATNEAVGRIVTTTLANIRSFAHGTPRNVIRGPAG